MKNSQKQRFEKRFNKNRRTKRVNNPTFIHMANVEAIILEFFLYIIGNHAPILQTKHLVYLTLLNVFNSVHNRAFLWYSVLLQDSLDF